LGPLSLYAPFRYPLSPATHGSTASARVRDNRRKAHGRESASRGCPDRGLRFPGVEPRRLKHIGGKQSTIEFFGCSSKRWVLYHRLFTHELTLDKNFCASRVQENAKCSSVGDAPLGRRCKLRMEGKRRVRNEIIGYRNLDPVGGNVVGIGVGYIDAYGRDVVE